MVKRTCKRKETTGKAAAAPVEYHTTLGVIVVRLKIEKIEIILALPFMIFKHKVMGKMI